MTMLQQIEQALLDEINGKPHPELSSEIGSLHMEPAECLGICREQNLRLQKGALASLYPASKALLGDSFFDQLCVTYSQRFGSETDDLMHFGDRFPMLMVQLCQEHPELDSLKMLPELSLMEWHLYSCRHSPEDRPLDTEQLAALPEILSPMLAFDVCRNLRLMYCIWPVMEFLQAENGVPDKPLEARGCQQWVCIYRYENATRIEQINDTLAAVLGALLKGYSLGEMAQQSLDISCHLPDLLARNWLSGYHLIEEQA
ncbi:HvfC/BufC N-terminal domain-containing protein [Marinobacterium jannaschii]|uniref:HvfC/BufC N-terminal domain-containing protein n=1 Tax=Marinobacterium jannaschii TaxID=64970 RepID=UPI00048774F5|nr:DNA-binding domain-containing protein [Marinobacterium jannaschii]